MTSQSSVGLLAVGLIVVISARTLSRNQSNQRHLVIAHR
jgi:hypothetical protein